MRSTCLTEVSCVLNEFMNQFHEDLAGGTSVSECVVNICQDLPVWIAWLQVHQPLGLFLADSDGLHDLGQAR